MRNLDGKVAVITGGATGIGRALALSLARAGMRVVLASTNESRLEAAAAAVREIGGQATVVLCDVSRRSDVEALAERAIAAYGAVHLVCANAAVTTIGPFIDHRIADWEWVFDVVLGGVANCVQVFYPLLVKQGEGHIMITGSQAGLVPDWVLGHGPYTAAKSAVMALGVALRPEAAEHGIGVSVLIPGGTESDILSSARSRPARYGESADGELRVPPDPPVVMMSAEDVAAQAVNGIRNNDAFIATHPDMKALTAEYFNRILSAYDR